MVQVNAKFAPDFLVRLRHNLDLLALPRVAPVVDPHPQSEEVEQLASAQDREPHAEPHNPPE